MSGRFTILGCGSSGGVPRVAQGWGACNPANPRNRRRRCSALVERFSDGGATRALIDVSPDLRMQLLDADVRALDGVIMTHPHADHMHGVDDLRPMVLATQKLVDIYMDGATSDVMRRTFSYVFQTPPGSNYPPMLRETRVAAGVRFAIMGPGGALNALPFALTHGEISALGFRIDALAYTPDVSDIPEASVGALENLDVWIIDALRYRRHPSHFSVEEALAWIERLKPKRALLTNLHTDLDFDELSQRLPPHVSPAYDGLAIEFDETA